MRGTLKNFWVNNEWGLKENKTLQYSVIKLAIRRVVRIHLLLHKAVSKAVVTVVPRLSTIIRSS